MTLWSEPNKKYVAKLREVAPSADPATRTYLAKFSLPGAGDNVSLGMALILGTAGLPHILMRFFTVPDGKAARASVAWAMGLIGSFYIMTTFLGFGAATLVGKANICASVVNGACVGTPNSNLAAPRLAQFLGGEFFGMVMVSDSEEHREYYRAVAHVEQAHSGSGPSHGDYKSGAE